MYEYIERLMKIKGVTTYELQNKLKIASSSLAAWKKGSKPSVENLEKLADYFDVPITYFFDGKIIKEQQDNFTNEDLILAREINKSDKIELIKDIMKIQKDSERKMINDMVKIFLEKK